MQMIIIILYLTHSINGFISYRLQISSLVLHAQHSTGSSSPRATIITRLEINQ